MGKSFSELSEEERSRLITTDAFKGLSDAVSGIVGKIAEKGLLERVYNCFVPVDSMTSDEAIKLLNHVALADRMRDMQLSDAEFASIQETYIAISKGNWSEELIAKIENVTYDPRYIARLIKFEKMCVAYFESKGIVNIDVSALVDLRSAFLGMGTRIKYEYEEGRILVCRMNNGPLGMGRTAGPEFIAMVPEFMKLVAFGGNCVGGTGVIDQEAEKLLTAICTMIQERNAGVPLNGRFSDDFSKRTEFLTRLMAKYRQIVAVHDAVLAGQGKMLLPGREVAVEELIGMDRNLVVGLAAADRMRKVGPAEPDERREEQARREAEEREKAKKEAEEQERRAAEEKEEKERLNKALREAANLGDAVKLQELLKAGAEVNEGDERGSTALMLAAAAPLKVPLS